MDWESLHGEAFAGRRVLITGGAGFIGSHLCDALAELGAEVVALDDLSGGDWANLEPNADRVRRHTGSILDSDTLAEVTASCDYVFHQAALGSVPRSVAEPMRFYQVNTIGTVNVLEAARAAGVHRVVFAGSSSAYGDPPEEGPKLETMPPRPLSPYAATKLDGEHACHAWTHSYGLDTAVLRYFNIFGPRQNANSAYAAVIAAFAKAMNEGAGGTIFGDGDQSRDFTYVANAVHANLLAARSEQPLGGCLFNVACGGRISVNELHERMAHIYGLPNSRPAYEPPRAGDIRHSLANIEKARRTLSYEPVVSFDDGLRETVEWYRQTLSAG